MAEYRSPVGRAVWSVEASTGDSVLLIDSTYLVTVHPAPGRDVMEHARISTPDPECIARLQGSDRILGTYHR